MCQWSLDLVLIKHLWFSQQKLDTNNKKFRILSNDTYTSFFSAQSDMKTFFKSFALLSILAISFPTHATGDNSTQLERQLRHSGNRVCTVSASVSCTIDGTDGKKCDSLGLQPFGTCGPKAMTYKYTYCNLGHRNVHPVAPAPESGIHGTTATFRQELDTPKLLLGTLGPGVCKTFYKYEETDTCKPKMTGSLRFEGW